MKLRQLESLLGDLQQFSNPKVELEQYPAGPHIASRMLQTAENSFGDVSNKMVADFGCGCGTLGAAAALLGAEQVIAIAIHSESLELALENAESQGQIVDIVVMNPPFGTQKKGADVDFLCVDLKHVKKAALRDLNARSAEVLCELRYDVPQLYKFHKKNEVDIVVELWRFVPKRKQGKGPVSVV